MPLLDDVADAAARLRAKEAETQAARKELQKKIRAARDEGVSFAAIARAANLSREWIRRLYAE